MLGRQADLAHGPAVHDASGKSVTGLPASSSMQQLSLSSQRVHTSASLFY